VSAHSLLLFGSKPELLQRSQVIVGVPVLDYLASFDAADSDEVALYLSASGRSELLCLSLVSAAYAHAGDHLVPFGYHGNVHVREGGLVEGDELLGFLGAVDVSIGLVPDDIGGVDFIYEVGVIQRFPRAAPRALFSSADIPLLLSLARAPPERLRLL
jgi:hypothetical protein